LQRRRSQRKPIQKKPIEVKKNKIDFFDFSSQMNNKQSDVVQKDIYLYSERAPKIFE
jgi:hypothetical protein